MRGVFVLLILLLALLFSPFLYQSYLEQHYTAVDYEKDWRQMDSLVRVIDNQVTQSKKNNPAPTTSLSSHSKLVVFNPNTANLETLKNLGFAPTIAGRIIKYREAGGKFLQKSDLLKIYGISKATYHKVFNFIDLPETYINHTTFQPKQKASTTNKISREIQKPVNINTADTAELKKLKGIGSVLSARIVKYRNLLGGFLHTGQLTEVYGLKPETLALIQDKIFISPDYQPQLLNINEADISELIRHPYIKLETAKAIVNHRRKYGLFLKPEDVKEVKPVNEEVWSRIAGYIKV